MKVQWQVRSVAPTQGIAIDQDNPIQYLPVIDPWPSVRLRKEAFQTRHLRIAQPEKVAHVTAPFFELCITQRGENQCILTLTISAISNLNSVRWFFSMAVDII
jgi:hypothetical protein